MLLSSNSDAAGKCMRFALVSFVAVALSVSLSALDLEARPDSGFSDQGDFRIAQGDSGSMSERFRKYQDGGLDKEDPGARHQRPGQQGDEPDSDRRARFKEYLQQMPPEKRQQFKNRLQQMSPSERQEMMRKLRQKGHNGGPGDRPDVAGGDGGAPDEMAGEGGPGRRMQGRRQADFGEGGPGHRMQGRRQGDGGGQGDGGRGQLREQMQGGARGNRQRGAGQDQMRGGRQWFNRKPLDLSSLGLSEDQKTKIQQMRGKNALEARRINASLKQRRARIREMMFDPSATESDILSAHKELTGLQGQAEEIMIHDFLGIRSVLKEDQLQRLPELRPGRRQSQSPRVGVSDKSGL